MVILVDIPAETYHASATILNPVDDYNIPILRRNRNNRDKCRSKP